MEFSDGKPKQKGFFHSAGGWKFLGYEIQYTDPDL